MQPRQSDFSDSDTKIHVVKMAHVQPVDITILSDAQGVSSALHTELD